MAWAIYVAVVRHLQNAMLQADGDVGDMCVAGVLSVSSGWSVRWWHPGVEACAATSSVEMWGLRTKAWLFARHAGECACGKCQLVCSLHVHVLCGVKTPV